MHIAIMLCVNLNTYVIQDVSLTNFAVAIILLNRIVFSEANSTHPLNALARRQARHLRVINILLLAALW